MCQSVPIQEREFAEWHREQTERFQRSAELINNDFSIGWAAKAINVYLKTSAYVGDLGRPGLRSLLHPPIDTVLRNQILTRCGPELAAEVSFRSIASISTYGRYLEIMEGLRRFGQTLAPPCALFEVEQFWAV